jgi:uncharacterized protein YoxC
MASKEQNQNNQSNSNFDHFVALLDSISKNTLPTKEFLLKLEKDINSVFAILNDIQSKNNLNNEKIQELKEKILEIKNSIDELNESVDELNKKVKMFEWFVAVMSGVGVIIGLVFKILKD